MTQLYAEDAATIVADNPFAVVLRLGGRSIVLIPARHSRSNYADCRVTDRSTVLRFLNAAKSDSWAMAGLRRINSETQHDTNANQRDDVKLFDAIAEAVARGRIYAVMVDNERQQAVAGNSAINYHAVAGRFRSIANKETDFFTFLGDQLPELWCQAYAKMPHAGSDIVTVTDTGYNFIFDLQAERVVVAYGVSGFNPGKRDADRMRDFLGAVNSPGELKKIAAAAPSAAIGQQQMAAAQMSWRDRFFRTYGHKYDRGHFMSHRQGGGLDINLFPQRADINQGRSPQGVAYRSLEKACVASSVFCFSRPIYDDGTWVPAQLEYGVVHQTQRMQVMMFPNK